LGARAEKDTPQEGYSRQAALLARRHPPQPLSLPGDVPAPDEKAAEAVAAVEFKLSDDQRKRVVMQQRE
jgi:hypothetical protein